MIFHYKVCYHPSLPKFSARSRHPAPYIPLSYCFLIRLIVARYITNYMVNIIYYYPYLALSFFRKFSTRTGIIVFIMRSVAQNYRELASNYYPDLSKFSLKKWNPAKPFICFVYSCVHLFKVQMFSQLALLLATFLRFSVDENSLPWYVKVRYYVISQSKPIFLQKLLRSI